MPNLDISIISLAVLIVGAIALLEFYFLVGLLAEKIFKKKFPIQLGKLPAIILNALFVVLLVFFVRAYFFEPYQLEVANISFSTPKLKASSFRIIQISDLHCDQIIRAETKVMRAVNNLRPDAVIFTGDTINSPQALKLFKALMASLRSKVKIAVQGNIDEYYWRALDLFNATGFKELTHESLALKKGKDTIYICGLNYSRPDRLAFALRKVPQNSFKVLAYHTPDIIDAAQREKIDLYLCGHTHGGQIRVPGYGALVTFSKYGKKYEAGPYKIGNTLMYVSRGVGMEKNALRLRLFCAPEITVIDIQPSAF